MFVLFALAGIVEASTPGGMDDESREAIIIGVLIFFCLAGNLVGVGLGTRTTRSRDIADPLRDREVATDTYHPR